MCMKWSVEALNIKTGTMGVNFHFILNLIDYDRVQTLLTTDVLIRLWGVNLVVESLMVIFSLLDSVRVAARTYDYCDDAVLLTPWLYLPDTNRYTRDGKQFPKTQLQGNMGGGTSSFSFLWTLVNSVLSSEDQIICHWKYITDNRSMFVLFPNTVQY